MTNLDNALKQAASAYNGESDEALGHLQDQLTRQSGVLQDAARSFYAQQMSGRAAGPISPLMHCARQLNYDTHSLSIAHLL